jgi:transcriptional regulator with XRE-family HTH domain
MTRTQSGLDLMYARRRMGLRQSEIADALGVSSQRISALERMYAPPAPAVARYLAALERLGAG